jgi:hypothetical protein
MGTVLYLPYNVPLPAAVLAPIKVLKRIRQLKIQQEIECPRCSDISWHYLLSKSEDKFLISILLPYSTGLVSAKQVKELQARCVDKIFD